MIRGTRRINTVVLVIQAAFLNELNSLAPASEDCAMKEDITECDQKFRSCEKVCVAAIWLCGQRTVRGETVVLEIMNDTKFMSSSQDRSCQDARFTGSRTPSHSHSSSVPPTSIHAWIFYHPFHHTCWWDISSSCIPLRHKLFNCHWNSMAFLP